MSISPQRRRERRGIAETSPLRLCGYGLFVLAAELRLVCGLMVIVTCFRIGIISDTHGLLRPEVVDAFRGVHRIIHAGDVGGDEVISRLKEIAPVTYVPGNVDDGAGEKIERLTVNGLRILVTHILPRPYARDPRVVRALEQEPADFVIFGHSHLPHDEVFDRTRYFNPASAGPRRFDYPVSVGLIETQKDSWIAWHVPLDDRSVDALKKRMNQLSR